MEKWLVANKGADFESWSKTYGISPVLARIIRNRGLTDSSRVGMFLNGKLTDCHSPWLLTDMDRAVAGLCEAIGKGELIRVIGDYDVDGICSSYILTRGLRKLGARVDTAIPHRIHDGYGLNDHLIEEAAEDGVKWIVTCDNGIAASSQVQLAGELGMQVIITDHHEVPFEENGEERKELLPIAFAVVDPKRAEDTYPFSGICGAVVAYKLIRALTERMEENGGVPNMGDVLEELLEFAAFATVCDVMELADENRVLVKEGLKRIRRTQNPGLRALIQVNGLKQEEINVYHLGFVLGPCLNATGRLDTAKRALELLECTTVSEAVEIATQLKELNDSRKNLTLQGVELAEQYIEERQLKKDKVWILYLPRVHESLAGIIAGRIREKYYHPVFVLTRGEDGVKGSGRSIESYHMYDGMSAVKQYFTRFGGHKMAAGLSMREEDLEAFRREINEKAALTEDDFIPRVHIDMVLPLSIADMGLAEELELLEPFGVGNPKPLFAQKDLLFVGASLMGKNRSMARFRVKCDNGEQKQMVYFGDAENFKTFLEEKYGPGSFDTLLAGQGSYPVSVVYQLGINNYQGRSQVQYILTNFC